MTSRRLIIVLLLGSTLAGVLFFGWLAYVDTPQPGYGGKRAGALFQDCPDCPEMIEIAAGISPMGGEPGRREYWLGRWGVWRTPERQISIKHRFAVGRYEVTFEQWDACVEAGGCGGYRPADEGWGRGRRPVIHVSWNDAQSYVRWISGRTGARYRLLTEAEWEFSARAGSPLPYPWGRRPTHDGANFGKDGPCCEGLVEGRDRWLNTAPVGQFPANAFGLHDMNGNVYEWVEDCFIYVLTDAPRDGRPVLTGPCDKHSMRGGAWYSDPLRISTSYRAFQAPDHRHRVIGFRVAKDL